MCTVVVLNRPNFVLLAANRDERLDRPWDPPAEYWPGIVGGRDRTAGGTWMGLNHHGVVVAVLNRPGTLGPVAGKRSRGELPLLALQQRSALQSAAAITSLDAAQWRGFNMIIADRGGAIFVKGLGKGAPLAHPLPPGVSMVTAYDPNDLESARTARHLPAFQANEPTGTHDWEAWRLILSDKSGATDQQINVIPRGGFGTVCSSLLAFAGNAEAVWRFADGPPDVADYKPVPPFART